MTIAGSTRYTPSKLAVRRTVTRIRGYIVKILACFAKGFSTGRGRARGTVVTNFVKVAFKRLPLTIFGGKLQYRNFVFLQDLVAGTLPRLITWP